MIVLVDNLYPTISDSMAGFYTEVEGEIFFTLISTEMSANLLLKHLNFYTTSIITLCFTLKATVLMIMLGGKIPWAPLCIQPCEHNAHEGAVDRHGQ